MDDVILPLLGVYESDNYKKGFQDQLAVRIDEKFIINPWMISVDRSFNIIPRMKDISLEWSLIRTKIERHKMDWYWCNEILILWSDTLCTHQIKHRKLQIKRTYTSIIKCVEYLDCLVGCLRLVYEMLLFHVIIKDNNQQLQRNFHQWFTRIIEQIVIVSKNQWQESITNEAWIWIWITIIRA